MVSKTHVPSAETINNLILLDNSLYHVGFELSRKRPSFFRVAREAHLVLLRAMVEALRGTANLAIVGGRDRKRAVIYRSGNQSWQEIHRVAVPGCKKAWRFSAPAPCPPPAKPTGPTQLSALDEHLLGFYDLVAMIQTQRYMVKLCGAQCAALSDAELREIEWLHEQVRNEFEHYVPKSYTIGGAALVGASALALRIAQWLLFTSGTVHDIFVPHGVERRLARLLSRIARLAKSVTRKNGTSTIFDA